MSGTTTYSPTLYGCSEPSGRLPTGPLNIKQNWQDLLRYACGRARTGMPAPSKVIQKIRTGPVDGVTEAHYPRYSRGIAYQPPHRIKLENKKPPNPFPRRESPFWKATTNSAFVEVGEARVEPDWRITAIPLRFCSSPLACCGIVVWLGF
jgi:hypothetical protein